MLKKNDIVPLTITSATAEGSGVGKTADGMAVFVPLSAVGDELDVRILKVKKTYAFGKIENIIKPAPSRVAPDCPHFSKCGGCVWRHISYKEECEIKRQKVADAVSRIGGLDAPVMPIIGSGRELRYRNKAQLPVGLSREGGLCMGFYALHSHRIIDCDDCLLQPECFADVMRITREFMEKTDNDVYDEATGKGRLRHLYIRLGEVTNELMVCYVVNGNGLKQEDILLKMLREGLPNLKTVVINSNRENTNVMLDLYCGTGTIGLSMAKDCKKLIGVEIIEDAVRDAENNAAVNSICNARFMCADAPEAAARLESEGVRPDVVVLDPPRKGCGEELVRTIGKMAPKRVVYVSCDPATLARDLKTFADIGYETKEVTPVDMFPRTAHVESVALVGKKDILMKNKS